MTDFEKLTETLEALNIAYKITASKNRIDISIILGSEDDDKKVPGTGYANCSRDIYF